MTFSQQPQQTVGEVIVTVKQVFPEYSDSVIHGLIVSELKSNVSKTPSSSQLSCAVVANGNGGRTDTGLVTLCTVGLLLMFV